ncbi:MAG: peptide chain release factor 2 [Clostridia bacterium]|nr:peptide chain release factor 2 [Clostridia bacterium]
MLEFEELRLQLEGHKGELKELYQAIGFDSLKNELAELEATTAKSDFWDDMEATQGVLKRISFIKARMSDYKSLETKYEDVLTLIEMGNEEEDLTLLDECKAELSEFERELETQTLSTLLTGEYDHNNAILTFHAGAGGTEAQDWVQMLYRMYVHWAEQHNYKTSLIDFLNGDEAGLKSAVLRVEGVNAYGYLKSENGVHRLVRISPFDSSGRRHTSFASLEVMPEIDDSVEVDIAPEDLKVDTYRSSGAGGQHVNKTESAIRITHLPTGIIVACQNERSQHQNRETAMKMLKSKLIEIKEREHLDKISDIKGEQKEIGWGSQIRSYVFMPYTMAKDHRTGYEMGNINAVMDGDIDGFINAYLKMESLKALGEDQN